MPTVEIEYLRNGNKDYIQAAGLLSDYFETTIGNGQSVEIYIENVNDGSAYGTGDYGSGAYGNLDGAYNALQDLIDAAGPAAAGTNLDGSAWFVDRVRTNANVDSLLVAVQPINMKEMRGIWGIVTGGDNSTTLVNSFAPISLEIQVLARYDEYSDRTAIKNALETGVP